MNTILFIFCQERQMLFLLIVIFCLPSIRGLLGLPILSHFNARTLPRGVSPLSRLSPRPPQATIPPRIERDGFGGREMTVKARTWRRHRANGIRQQGIGRSTTCSLSVARRSFRLFSIPDPDPRANVPGIFSSPLRTLRPGHRNQHGGQDHI